jgi:threonine/homoserine/homoserine lactone efflux protein
MPPLAGLSLATGCVAGFLGAIPPGPVGLGVAARAGEGRTTDALLMGLGGALVDTTARAAIAVGAGPLLLRMCAHPPVRFALSLVYVAIGATILLRKAPSAPTAASRMRRAFPSWAEGAGRAALNPATVANWTLLLAALETTGLVGTRVPDGLAFAAGIGVGVTLWFWALTRVLASPRVRAKGAAIRLGTAVAALTLVATGSLGALRAIVP